MSVGAMHDIANSTVTVVAGAVPAPAAPAAPRTTVSAHASSMVDAGAGQAQPAAGTFGEWFGAPEVGGCMAGWGWGGIVFHGGRLGCAAGLNMHAACILPAVS